jgi:uncharacterized membrane protein YjjP (DUF1212 family)
VRELTNLLRLLGVALCMSGEATSRVAAHLDEVARGYGVTGTRFFVLPTGVFARTVDGEEVTVDFAPAGGGVTLRLDQINGVYDLLAETKQGTPEPDEAARRVVSILDSSPHRSPVVTVIGHALLVAGLGLVTNPTPTGLACYAMLGAMVGLIKLVGETFSILSEALPVVAGLLVYVAAVELAGPLHVATASRLVIPPLVTLLPGTALTIGCLELATGEMVSGASRLIYGLNVLLLLAFGILIGHHLVGNPGPGEHAAALGWWAPWAGVICIGVGFFLHFSAPARSLPWLLGVLYVVWGAQTAGTAMAGSSLAGAFLAGLAITPAAYFVQAQRGGPPAQVTFLPSFWMLVPGALGLAGVSEIVVHGPADSATDIVQTLLTIVAISLGMMVGASLTQTVAKPTSWLDAPPELKQPLAPRIVTPSDPLKAAAEPFKEPLKTAAEPLRSIRFRPGKKRLSLVPVLPGADARLVALRVGEHPECGGLAVVGEPTARRQHCVDALPCLVVRYRHVEVHAVALRPRRVHLLEPDGRPLPGRVD